MRVLSWNVDFKAITRARVEEIVKRIAALDPELIGLQEVPVGWDEDYEELLGNANYEFVEYARKRGDANKYGNLIASRLDSKVMDDTKARVIYPEFAAHAVVGGLHFFSLHVPNGEGFGFDKIRFLQAIRGLLESIDAPRLVMGDFNAPALEYPGGALCFGIELGHEGRWKPASSVADALGRDAALKLREDPEYWRYWADGPGFPGGGEAWEEEEAWLFNSAAESGIRDLFRELHPVGSAEPDTSLVIKSGGGRERRYDHAFGSADVRVTSAKYYRAAIDDGLSDHAPLVVEIEVGVRQRARP